MVSELVRRGYYPGFVLCFAKVRTDDANHVRSRNLVEVCGPGKQMLWAALLKQGGVENKDTWPSGVLCVHFQVRIMV